MTDFGLGDKALDEKKMLQTLRYHGLVDKEERTDFPPSKPKDPFPHGPPTTIPVPEKTVPPNKPTEKR